MFGEDAKEAIGEGRCVSVCTQDALTLLEFSACSGFPGLTIQHLSDLAHEIGICWGEDKPKPKLEAEWLTALTQHVVGPLNEQELAAFIGCRVS